MRTRSTENHVTHDGEEREAAAEVEHERHEAELAGLTVDVDDEAQAVRLDQVAVLGAVLVVVVRVAAGLSKQHTHSQTQSMPRAYLMKQNCVAHFDCDITHNANKHVIYTRKLQVEQG